MKRLLPNLLVAIFSIFIGSQITEGVLLVPYWQSLSSADFYAYYNEFGPSIGRFYTILTILAAVIPIVVSVYCKTINSSALKFALLSSFFSILFVSSFYIYFKDTNALFYQATLSDIDLKNELITWSTWHWGRIIVEFAALFFLIFTFSKLRNDKVS